MSFNHARSVTEPPPLITTRASNGLCLWAVRAWRMAVWIEDDVSTPWKVAGKKWNSHNIALWSRSASRRKSPSPAEVSGLITATLTNSTGAGSRLSTRHARRGVRVRRPTRPAGLDFHSSEQPKSPGTGRRPGLGCTLRERKNLSNSGGTGCTSCCQVLEGRKPVLVLRFAGAFLLRFAERTFAG
jgi:hypothetical protein